MIFKKFFTVIMMLPLLLAAENFSVSNGETALLRPILFRSEFLSRGTLRALQKYSTLDEYDVFGFPKFEKVYINRNLHFWETRLAQTRAYARYLNRLNRQYIIDHPELFHSDTIRDYKLGFTSKNPRAVDGTELVWHHDRNGYKLVAETEHGKLSHAGGASTYGYKYAEASAKIPNREIILTAQRWGKFVALDMAFSTIGLAVSGESNWQTYAANAAASTTAGFVAWGIESLLITAFPLMQGGTPMFIGGCAINLGGPASWIAAGSFLLVKYAIMTGWQHYQLQEALAVEARCKLAEKNARFRLLKRQCEQNTARLQAFLMDSDAEPDNGQAYPDID